MKETKPKNQTKTPQSQSRGPVTPPRSPKAKIPPKPKPPKEETQAQRQRRLLIEATDKAIAEARKGLNGCAAEVLARMLREDRELFDAFHDKLVRACRDWITDRQVDIRKEIEEEMRLRAAEGRSLSGVPSANPPTRGQKDYEESPPLRGVDSEPPRIRTWYEYPLPIKDYPILGESTPEQRAAAQRYYRRMGKAYFIRADFLGAVEDGVQAGKKLTNEFIQECAVQVGLSQDDAQKPEPKI
jgi:hypothetical protein